MQRLNDVIVNRAAPLHWVELREWFNIERVTKNVWMYIQDAWLHLQEKLGIPETMLQTVTLQTSTRWVLLYTAGAVDAEKTKP